MSMPSAAPGGVSRTSRAVALIRAEIPDRPHSPDGLTDAQQRLCEGMPPTPNRRLRPSIAARTRFFDQQVLDALSRGVRQVVVCGAGYDDRALRFRLTGARFFELDHPGTQHDKAARLARLDTDLSGLTLVPADFRTDDAAEALAFAGHGASQPTLFLCEGLLIYLDEPTIVRLLTTLRSRSTDAGSGLAASMAVIPPGVSPDAAATTANARRGNGTTEPWRTLLPRDALRPLFAAGGWHINNDVDATELDADAPHDRAAFLILRPDAPVPEVSSA
jgi:methyltransferase (TIGR00027 family)